MNLRWQDGDRVGVESYLARYPDLGDEALVALIYEEFCLREDADEAPDPAEFEARFPAVAPGLRRVLDIHGLVGSGQASPSVPHPQAPAIPFPEAGQTIAGFRLVEELGRGAFARVFLAEERQLADRPVALKVARAGSREPQTLARLQHTHIVPVHSYRTDPATGLHLLCMPYFGRVTLAQVLADPRVRVARSGADLVEALDRLGPSEGPRLARSAGRSALAGRTFAQAIAWWGARMAEALGHAHDRGVLHRDVKPSNVLVTDDAMPMLLDFNLAREVALDDPEAPPHVLGGTLDYMAPEHLEALAEGTADGVDSRSDIYGLGVVLYEALMGVRPFPTPREALSVGEALLTAAEMRRAGAPRLRTIRPEVPAALESVVRRCLAPEPSDRYASAADLVIDLQAVADDRSLRFAREPLVEPFLPLAPPQPSPARDGPPRRPGRVGRRRHLRQATRRRLPPPLRDRPPVRRGETLRPGESVRRGDGPVRRGGTIGPQADGATRAAEEPPRPLPEGTGTPRRPRADRGHPRAVPQGPRILPGNGGGRDDRRQRQCRLRTPRSPSDSASPAWRGTRRRRRATCKPCSSRSPSPRPTTGPNNEWS